MNSQYTAVALQQGAPPDKMHSVPDPARYIPQHGQRICHSHLPKKESLLCR